MSDLAALRGMVRFPTARLLSAALLAMAAVVPASAQDRPREMPSRDVAVTYRMIGGPADQTEVRMAWLVAENRLRVDLPGGIGWMLVDHKDLGASFMVLDAQRVVMPLPPGASPAAAAPPTPASPARCGATRTSAGRPAIPASPRTGCCCAP